MPTINQGTFKGNYDEIKKSNQELEKIKKEIYNSDDEFDDNFLINNSASDAVSLVEYAYQQVSNVRKKLEIVEEVGNIEDTKKLNNNIEKAKQIENTYKSIARELIETYNNGGAIDEREQKYLNEMSIVKDMN